MKTMSVATGETPTGDGWKRTGDTWTRDRRFGVGRFPAVYRSVSPTVLDLPVDTLPTEPVALAALLRRELAEAAADDDPETGFVGGPDASSGELLIVIGQILADPLARPELRSALYEVAGTLEGADVDEHGQDPNGRRAAVIGLDETTKSGGANRYELFFDPRTSATLATRLTTVELVSAEPVATPDPDGIQSEPDQGPRVRTTFTDFTIYEQRGTVDSIHARP